MADPESRRLENVVVARPSRNTVSAIRSQFDHKNSKSPIDAEFSPTSPHSVHPDEVELDIRVHVERSVTVDYLNDSGHSSSGGKSAG